MYMYVNYPPAGNVKIKRHVHVRRPACFTRSAPRPCTCRVALGGHDQIYNEARGEQCHGAQTYRWKRRHPRRGTNYKSDAAQKPGPASAGAGSPSAARGLDIISSSVWCLLIRPSLQVWLAVLFSRHSAYAFNARIRLEISYKLIQ
jgi:hypothetical protein